MKLQGLILGGALLLGVTTVAHAGDYDDTASRADVKQLGKDAGACLYGNSAALARLRILTADGGLCAGYDDDSGALASCGRTIADWSATHQDITTQQGKPGANVHACDAALVDWQSPITRIGVYADIVGEMNEINSGTK